MALYTPFADRKRELRLKPHTVAQDLTRFRNQQRQQWLASNSSSVHMGDNVRAQTAVGRLRGAHENMLLPFVDVAQPMAGSSVVDAMQQQLPPPHFQRPFTASGSLREGSSLIMLERRSADHRNMTAAVLGLEGSLAISSTISHAVPEKEMQGKRQQKMKNKKKKKKNKNKNKKTENRKVKKMRKQKMEARLPRVHTAQHITRTPPSSGSRMTRSRSSPYARAASSMPAMVRPAHADRIPEWEMAEPRPTSPLQQVLANVKASKSNTNARDRFGSEMLRALGEEREALLDDAARYRAIVASEISETRETLPLSFLFEHSASKYCQQRAFENIEKILRRFLFSRLMAGFERWRRGVEHVRVEALRAEMAARQREHGTAGFVKFGQRMMQKDMAAAWRQWRRFVRGCRVQDRHKAARKIQFLWRHYTGVWNALRRSKRLAELNARRNTMISRLLFLDWLAKHRLDAQVAHRRRAILERQSANAIRRAWLDHVMRVEAQNELKQRRAAACLRRFIYRHFVRAFNGWSAYTSVMQRCKAMARRALMTGLALRFELWHDFVEETKLARSNESAAMRYLRHLLNRQAAKCMLQWRAYTEQQISLRRMMRRSLLSGLALRFEMWYDYAQGVKDARLSEEARRKRECERIVKQCLLRMRNRKLSAIWRTFHSNVVEARENAARARACLARFLNQRAAAALASWAAYTYRMQQVRRMMRRALATVLQRRFTLWHEFAEASKEARMSEEAKRRRECERLVIAALARMSMRALAMSFDMLALNAYQNRSVRAMLRRALGHKKARCWHKWETFLRETRQNHAVALGAFKQWWQRQQAKAFRQWAAYCERMKAMREKYARALVGKRDLVFIEWKGYALRCRAYKAQQALKLAAKQKGPTCKIELSADVKDILKMPPREISALQVLLMVRATARLDQRYALMERMALRVQCSYRCRQGRLSLFLKRRAYEERCREMLWAVLKLQRIVRGKQDREKVKEKLKKLKKEKIKQQYILERQAKAARERWEHDREEMLHRAKVDREIAQRKKQQEKEWEVERARIAKAWEIVPTETSEFDEDGKPTTDFYYYNSITEESQWARPENYDDGEPPPPPPSEEQIKTAWVVKEDEYGNQFFFNGLTEETRWDPPEGFEPPVPKGKCFVCRSEDAVRHCKACDQPYCMACFIQEHRTPAKRAHLFRVLKKASAPTFRCGVCFDRQACRATPDFANLFCEPCFASLENDERLENGYRSFKEGSTVCSECGKRLAEEHCKDCDDSYCHGCFGTLHATGRKVSHLSSEINPWLRDELAEGQAHCVECDSSVATRVCDQCGDGYCERCFIRTHKRGKKALHTWRTWEEAQTPWEEFFDEDQQRPIYYNTLTKERTYDKPPALLWGTERMAFLEKEEARRMMNESQDDAMKALQEQILQLQAEKAEALKKKPSRFVRGLKSVAKTLTPSLAVDQEEKEKEDAEFLAAFEAAGGVSSSPGDARRARLLRKQAKERRKKEGTARKKSSLGRSILKDPKSLMNPLALVKDKKREQRGLDERYLRKMLKGKTEIDAGLEGTKRKEAELAAYESSMMAYLAKARKDGREEEFRNEVKLVKEMREKEEQEEKEKKRKKSRFR
eukprot:g3793.t1